MIAQPGPKVLRVVTSAMFPRHDRTATRVEFSAENLAAGAAEAEALSAASGDALKVVGWFHTHPNITIHPSHVDLRTQGECQSLGSGFVGLIASVLTIGAEEDSKRSWLTAFQSIKIDGQWERLEVPLHITSGFCPSTDSLWARSDIVTAGSSLANGTIGSARLITLRHDPPRCLPRVTQLRATCSCVAEALCRRLQLPFLPLEEAMPAWVSRSSVPRDPTGGVPQEDSGKAPTWSSVAAAGRALEAVSLAGEQSRAAQWGIRATHARALAAQAASRAVALAPAGNAPAGAVAGTCSTWRPVRASDASTATYGGWIPDAAELTGTSAGLSTPWIPRSERASKPVVAAEVAVPSTAEVAAAGTDRDATAAASAAGPPAPSDSPSASPSAVDVPLAGAAGGGSGSEVIAAGLAPAAPKEGGFWDSARAVLPEEARNALPLLSSEAQSALVLAGSAAVAEASMSGIEAFMRRPLWGVMVVRTMMGFRTDVQPAAVRLRRLAAVEGRSPRAMAGWELVFLRVNPPELPASATTFQRFSALDVLMHSAMATPISAGWLTGGRVTQVSDATTDLLLKKSFPKLPAASAWLLDQKSRPFAVRIAADSIAGGSMLLFVPPADYVRLLAWAAPTIAAESV